MFCKIFTCKTCPTSMFTCCHHCTQYPRCKKRGNDVCENNPDICRMSTDSKYEVVPLSKRLRGTLWYKLAFKN